MDPLTQAALGALCGELTLHKKLGWRAAAWGAFFGTLPDLDIIAYAWMDAEEQLLWHRGISHSILLWIVGALVFGWLLSKIHQKRGLKAKPAIFFVFLALATHTLIDCFNAYGAQIMEPFSSLRFTLNCMGVIDPFFTLPMVLGIIWALKCGIKKPRLRQWIGYLTAGWLSIYFCSSIALKIKAQRQFANRLAEWGVSPKAITTSPSIGNIFLWRMVARDDEFFYVGYWSFWDNEERKQHYDFHQFEHGHELAWNFKDSSQLRTLKWFSKGWWKAYQDEEKPDTLYIAALNLGELRTQEGDEKKIRPAFIWSITRQPDGSYEMDRPFKLSKDGHKHASKGLPLLIDRVKGKGEDWMNYKWPWPLKK